MTSLRLTRVSRSLTDPKGPIMAKTDKTARREITEIIVAARRPLAVAANHLRQTSVLTRNWQLEEAPAFGTDDWHEVAKRCDQAIVQLEDAARMCRARALMLEWYGGY